jgi:pimeloyl-ACP methyl ester carboxylesterase
MRNVQAKRPSLYDLEKDLKKIRVPTLLVTGDEDEPCLDANVFMKRTIPSSALYVMPKTGHACNLEDPAAFNRALEDFFHTVEAGRWSLRDPRSLSTSILSVTKAGGAKKKAA